jgi:hypothetical protein
MLQQVGTAQRQEQSFSRGTNQAVRARTVCYIHALYTRSMIHASLDMLWEGCIMTLGMVTMVMLQI